MTDERIAEIREVMADRTTGVLNADWLCDAIADLLAENAKLTRAVLAAKRLVYVDREVSSLHHGGKPAPDIYADSMEHALREWTEALADLPQQRTVRELAREAARGISTPPEGDWLATGAVDAE